MPHAIDEAVPTDGARFQGARLPHVLLVEDDPVSREFLRAAVEALPARVEAAGDIASALHAARQQSFAAWLIDAHLPDGHGDDLLGRLRVDAPDTPAIAHTASTDAATLDGLMAAGFCEVLIKPLTAAALQSALRRAISGQPTRVERAPGCGKQPVWDQAAALAALNGRSDHVTALRQLFRGELPAQRAALAAAAAAGRHEDMRRDLHRLRASCGFVGAPRLAVAVQALHARPGDAQLLQDFEHAVEDLLTSGDALTGA